MKATYYNDTMRSYMIIPCPQEAETEGYQYRMLEMNRIEGLLPCGLRFIDGERYLYYEVTGKQSMRSLYEGRKIAGKELFRLLEDMECISGSLAGYLLDEQHLVLSEDQVFYDFGTGHYCFTYYPGDASEPEIFRFLADSIDGKDKRAAAAAYRLCSIADGDRKALREAVREEAAQREEAAPWEQAVRERTAAREYAAGREYTAGREYSAGEYAAGRGYAAAKDYMTGRRDAAERNGGAEDRAAKEKKLLGRAGYRETEEQEDGEKRKGPDQKGSRRGKRIGLFRRRREERPYVRDPAEELPREKMEGDKGGRSLDKRQVIVRVLLIMLLLIGSGALIAVPILLYISDRERRLCTAGAILLMAAACLLIADLILKRRRDRNRKAEEEKSRTPSYQRSDEMDMPLFGVGGKEDYRLSEDAASTVRFSQKETVGRLYGRDRGSRIDLRTLPVTIGKAQAYADVILGDASVSRVHARIYRGEDGSIEIRDLDSTNGTWINGVRLGPNEKARVQRGDEVRFGSVEFEYR